jgi:hypothetical protein
MSELSGHVRDYLRLRRALGFKLERAGHLLPQLVAYLEAAGAATVTSELAIAWARLPQHAHPNHWAQRLAIARGFARYLQALDRRLAKATVDPARDAKHAQTVAALWERYRARAEANRTAQRGEPALETFRWLIEELKVSLFAQELRTPLPVSYKRLEKAWAELIRR